MPEATHLRAESYFINTVHVVRLPQVEGVCKGLLTCVLSFGGLFRALVATRPISILGKQ